MAKLGMINERPEFAQDPSWSETGDRYLLKLLRDYIFHQVKILRIVFLSFFFFFFFFFFFEKMSGCCWWNACNRNRTCCGLVEQIRCRHSRQGKAKKRNKNRKFLGGKKIFQRFRSFQKITRFGCLPSRPLTFYFLKLYFLDCATVFIQGFEEGGWWLFRRTGEKISNQMKRI